MRLSVFAEKRKALLQSGCQRGIDRHLAQRRLPRALAHDGQRMSHAGVVGAHQDAALRQIEPRIHRARHVSGVHVSGVRHHAARAPKRFSAAATNRIAPRPADRRDRADKSVQPRRDGGSARPCTLTFRQAVILSGEPASHREAGAQSKDPYKLIGSRRLEVLLDLAEVTENSLGDDTVPPIGVLRLRIPFASEWNAPLRMTALRQRAKQRRRLFQAQRFGSHRRFHSGLFERRPQDLRLILRFQIVRKRLPFLPESQFKKIDKVRFRHPQDYRASTPSGAAPRVESTLGGGENAPGGSVNSFSTRA